MGGATVPLVVSAFQALISIRTPNGGAALSRIQLGCCWNNFNPRSPWGERRRCKRRCRRHPNFNPRSPWGERPCRKCPRKRTLRFQSTLPVGGATLLVHALNVTIRISIHAPRGGSDRLVSCKMILTLLFQSTLPVGGATKSHKTQPEELEFQSTLPVGGATQAAPPLLGKRAISIHAPRGGSNPVPVAESDGNVYFNPRSPWGERRHLSRPISRASNFNPRSPWGERHPKAGTKIQPHSFQSTLPVGGATSLPVRAYGLI